MLTLTASVCSMTQGSDSISSIKLLRSSIVTTVSLKKKRDGLCQMKRCKLHDGWGTEHFWVDVGSVRMFAKATES